MDPKPARSAPASLPDLYPLRIISTEPAGRVFFRELPATQAVYVFKSFRVAFAWCRRHEAAPACGSVQMFAWKREFTAFALEKPLWYPLIALSEQLSRKHVDPRKVANACLAVGDWAIGQGARRTALLFGEVAASAASANPRYAWIVGRLGRKWDRCREAEYWFLRAIRAAVRIDDRYAQALGLNSLGNLYRHTGNFVLSKSFLERALKRAQRFGLMELEGEILHDLTLLSTFMGAFRDAERYGMLASERYGPQHANLPKLAHDLALIWADQGFFDRATGVYRSLLPHFSAPDERLRVLGALVRCAGSSGRRELFDLYWDEAWQIAHDPVAEPVLASVLVDMGKGAAGVADWKRATEALNWALHRAGASREADMLAAAEAALQAVGTHERLDITPRDPRENSKSDLFADSLRQKLHRDPATVVQSE